VCADVGAAGCDVNVNTGAPQQCVFPFKYHGQYFSGENGCTTWNHVEPWCATSVDADGKYDGKWINCGTCSTCGSVETCDSGAHACLPKWTYKFKGKPKTYTECTSDNAVMAADGKTPRPWCSTLNDQTGKMVSWENCDTCAAKGVESLKGCTKPCVFPFQYGDSAGKLATFDSCTTANHNTKWCATSVNKYGVMNTWENCGKCKADGSALVVCETGAKTCQFPFVWQGKTYLQCAPGTAIGSRSNGKLWCATARDTKNNMMAWETCDACTPGKMPESTGGKFGWFLFFVLVVFPVVSLVLEKQDKAPWMAPIRNAIAKQTKASGPQESMYAGETSDDLEGAPQ